MSAWLARSAAAARLAADRADLSVPGTLAALVYLGWLPLVLVTAGGPRLGDLATLGSQLYSSGVYPWNVVLLAAAASGVVLLGCLLAALAEASLLRALRPAAGGASLAHDTATVASLMLLGALPATAALVGLSALAAAVAPGEFTSPDSGGPLLVRLLAALSPMLLVLAAALLVGQALAAAAMRRATGPAPEPILPALRSALRDLLRHPGRRLGLALAAGGVELAALGLSYLLLRVLWAPIAADLAASDLVSPTALLLLVGLVAIWLALLLVGGVIHAWTSAWWSLELGADDAAHA
jgi:hypothetical protein